MAIRPANMAPAISLFNSQVAQGAQQRAQEDQEFRQRFQMERGLSNDAGTRAVFAKYAQDRIDANQAPQMPPAVAPAPPMPPAQAPAISQIQAGPVPAPTAPGAISVPVQDFNVDPVAAQDFGSEKPLPLEMAAMRQPLQQAEIAPTQQRAPITLPSARRSAPVDNSANELMLGLSKVPGAGQAMMTMYSSDQTSRRQAATAERQLHMDGIKLFADASKNNDVATMRAVSQRYDLGIPPEALNRREFMANLAAGINTGKQLGIGDDELAVTYGMAYVDALARGADPRQALQAAFAAAGQKKREPQFKAVHWSQLPGGEVVAFDAATNMKPTGVRTRLPEPAVRVGADERDTRNDQALRDRALTDARAAAGRAGVWARMGTEEKNQLVNAYFEFLKYGTPLPAGMSAPSAPAAPAAGKPAAIAPAGGGSTGELEYKGRDANGRPIFAPGK